MRYRAAGRGVCLGLIVGLCSIAPALSATCVAGKPVIERSSPQMAACDCFDKTPAGTKVYAVDGYQVQTRTATESFGRAFSLDAIVSCDAEHLVLRSGREGDHVFPLVATSITRSTVNEQAVYPGDKPSADLAHEIEMGHAHLIRTM